MEEKTYLVIFWGKIIPLQGTAYILKAIELLAKRRPDIHFQFIGQKHPDTATAHFFARLPQAEIVPLIRQADICLGIFGDTDKATRVIPNKVYEAIAMGKAVISADTPAIGELFTDGENILLCNLADAEDLAKKIEQLCDDSELREKIAQGGHKLFQDKLTPKIIGADLLKNLRPKTIIYTAIFGDKDDLLEPTFKPADCDFICFTDNKNLKSQTWQIIYQKPIDSDPARAAKIYKILPHKYLSDYDYSVWVDSNITVRGDVNELIQRYMLGASMAFFDHNQTAMDPRDTVFSEAQFLIQRAQQGKGKDDPELIEQQMQKYKNENFPDQGGLIVGMEIVRRHNEPDVIKAMEAWWQEIQAGSRRDQLSFNYVAWKLGINFAYMAGDCRDNKYFKWQPHQK